MERNKLKQVEIVLENTEKMSFLPNEIEVLLIDDIKRRIFINDICERDDRKCGKMLMKIKKDANTEYCPHDIDSIKTTKFDNLMKFRDITVVILHYESGKELFYMPWKDADEYGFENEYQHTSIDSDGGLFIYIEGECEE